MTFTPRQQRVLAALDRFGANQRSRQPGERSKLARAIVGELSTVGGMPGPPPADQLALVLVLEERGPQTITELMALLGLAVATTSDLIGRAEASGRVQRHVDPADHRVHRVGLTARGMRERKRSRLNAGEKQESRPVEAVDNNKRK